MIIIPGQSGTYRHLHSRVTDLLAESGLTAAPPRDERLGLPERLRMPTAASTWVAARGPFISALFTRYAASKYSALNLPSLD
jgi:hypothetical protein